MEITANQWAGQGGAWSGLW